MRAINLLDQLEFREDGANSEALFFDADGRIIRFSLKPGQVIPAHRAANSPLYIIVIRGRGMFAGEDGVMQEFGPNSLLVFDRAESHSIEALDEELVFIAILRGATAARPPKKESR